MQNISSHTVYQFIILSVVLVDSWATRISSQIESALDYDASLSDRDDLTKWNDQQSKTIRHLQTRIKLLEKSQNEIYKTNGLMERENKTLKSQLEDCLKEMKSLKLVIWRDVFIWHWMIIVPFS